MTPLLRSRRKTGFRKQLFYEWKNRRPHIIRVVGECRAPNPDSEPPKDHDCHEKQQPHRYDIPLQHKKHHMETGESGLDEHCGVQVDLKGQAP